MNWRWVYTFPCQKLAPFVSPFTFPVSPFNGFTPSVAKFFFALFVPPLSNGASSATSDRKPKTNNQILPSPILCVRYIRWEREIQRERERERERERKTEVTSPLSRLNWRWVLHFSLPKMCNLVLATSFALFLAKKFAPQFVPSWMALSSNFPLPKTLHFSKRFAFFALSNGVLTGDRSSKANDRISGCTVLLSRRKIRKNESN